MRDSIARSIVVLLFVACGTHRPPGGGGGGGGGGGNVDAAGANCSEAAKRVYVVDIHNAVAEFDPPTKTFHPLGTLACPAMAMATPFSMAVARDATGWVLYSSGELFQVALATGLGCAATSWASPSGLKNFGMGFSTDTAGGTTDTLFIASKQATNVPTSALAKIDTTTMQAAVIGTAPGWLELTGTGSAQLWGFSPEEMIPRVVQLDKTSGTALATYPQPTLQGLPGAWAFAFWGGDFWIFYLRGAETASTVYQVDGMTGAITSQTLAAGLTIVGAGVSTCAPIVTQ
jgi:hypothetical protein